MVQQACSLLGRAEAVGLQLDVLQFAVRVGDSHRVVSKGTNEGTNGVHQ